MMKKPTRLLFVITGLSAGGAENMLCRLAIMHQQAGWEVMVISMTDGGWLVERMQAVGGSFVPAFGLSSAIAFSEIFISFGDSGEKNFQFPRQFSSRLDVSRQFFSLFIRLLRPRAAVFECPRC